MKAVALFEQPEPDFYLMLLSPPERIKSRVRDLKVHFNEAYGQFTGEQSLAHITLAAFYMDSSMESSLISKLVNFSRTQKPFPVSLKNFRQFDERTIYIGVYNEHRVNNLYKSLYQTLRFEARISRQFLRKQITPHMTVANRLERGQFHKAWKDFGQKTFQDGFLATEVTLLRMNAKEGRYDQVASFPLTGNSVAA